MKKIFNIITALFIFVLFGCNPLTQKPSNIKLKNIVPLATGNYWYYTSTFFQSPDSIKRVVSDTTTVTTDTIINKETWYRYNNIIKGPSSNYDSRITELAINRDSGLYIFSGETPNGFLFIPYPVNINDTFYIRERFFSDTTYSILSIKSTDTLITVPAGTYHCCAYSYLNSAIYYSPNIGLVKIETNAIYNGLKYLYFLKELQSCNIKSTT